MKEKEKRGFWCGGKGSSGSACVRFQNQNLLRIQPLSWTAGDHMMVCSGLWRPQAQLFYIFSTTTNLVIHSKRENLQWSRMTKGAIRRQERGKSLRCNFAVLPHTTPLGFKSLKFLLATDKNGAHFMPFETLHVGVWVFRWACNINIHKICGSIWSQEAPGVRKTFSNSLLNGRSKGPVKSNGVIKCKSGQ